jgi:hypothetical protein
MAPSTRTEPFMPDDRSERARATLEELGFRCNQLEPLSLAAPGRKRDRYTWKARLIDHSTVKIRKLEDSHAVDALVAVRRGLPPYLTPVIASHADFLVEAWVEGRELTNDAANERAFELGSMIGTLHRHSDHRTADGAAEPRREQAIAHLAALTDRGLIAAKVARTLTTVLRAADLGGRQTIVHLDFCPENIVCDPDGHLHVIDNEWLRVGAPGADIGRTYARWPASDDGWAQFLAGYSSVAVAPATSRFWLIAMAAASALIRIDGPADLMALPLARLTRLADT